MFNEKSQGIQRKYSSFKGKTKSTEAIPKKELIAHKLDKDFKATVLKMLKELKEDVEKLRKQCVNKM